MTDSQHSFFKRFRWLIVVIGLIVLGVAVVMVRGLLHNRQLEDERKESEKTIEQEQSVVKPTTKAILSLPFSSQDASDTLAPMGETMIHNDTPGNIGHSGIDFQWNSNKEINILASMDAEIISINTNPLGTQDIITERGGWSVEYDGMKLVNSELTVGQSIKRGDYLGQPNPVEPPTIGQGFHWQFGYYDKRENRAYPALCPLIYFDSESVRLIEKIWANTAWPQMRANAPYICSNWYQDKNQ